MLKHYLTVDLKVWNLKVTLAAPGWILCYFLCLKDIHIHFHLSIFHLLYSFCNNSYEWTMLAYLLSHPTLLLPIQFLPFVITVAQVITIYKTSHLPSNTVGPNPTPWTSPVNVGNDYNIKIIINLIIMFARA